MEVQSDKKNYAYVQPLFDGPLDIVGDIHGEVGALLNLLDRLGYDYDGNHLDSRRLVFVGDLVDRGPNSIAVVRLVKHLCEKGNAQCILGNHELNLLNGKRKHGNHWFWNEPERICKDKDRISFQALAKDKKTQDEFLSFFASLPVVLKNDSLSIVHAAYHRESLDQLKGFKWDPADPLSPITQAHEYFRKRIVADIEKRDIKDEVEIDLILQNDNPVKVLTTGLEEKTKEPFFAGGRLRTVGRKSWWESPELKLDRMVIIGHYWRRDLSRVHPRLSESYPKGFEPTGGNMFPNYKVNQLLGPQKKVMCVDYACGVRYEERALQLPDGSLGTSLAALRFPENTLLFEDGRVMSCK